LWQLLVPELSPPGVPRTPVPWVDYNPFSLDDWRRGGGLAQLVVQSVLALIGLSGVGATVAWVLYAIASGRGHKQRLTDPAPIIAEGDEVVAPQTT
jgi:hypothetical protein